MEIKIKLEEQFRRCDEYFQKFAFCVFLFFIEGTLLNSFESFNLSLQNVTHNIPRMYKKI